MWVENPKTTINNKVRVKQNILCLEEYSQSRQTSNMERLAKIANGFQLLTIFAKRSIPDI